MSLSGASSSSGVFDPGEGVVKGQCSIVKVSRPHGRPRKGKSPPFVAEPKFPSSMDP